MTDGAAAILAGLLPVWRAANADPTRLLSRSKTVLALNHS